jgi:hypothetical protein
MSWWTRVFASQSRPSVLPRKFPQPPHVCNAYCTEDLHAFVLFVATSLLHAEEWLPQMQQAVQAPWHPWQPVMARRAPEADVAAMIRFNQTYEVPSFDVGTQMIQESVDVPSPWLESHPWLVWYGLPDVLQAPEVLRKDRDA